MNSAIINLRVDPKLKRESKKVADKMGLPLAFVIKCFLKDLVKTKKVTFNVDEVPTPETARLLRKLQADIKAGRNMSPIFDNAEDAIAWLNTPDKKWKNGKWNGHKASHGIYKTVQKVSHQSPKSI